MVPEGINSAFSFNEQYQRAMLSASENEQQAKLHSVIFVVTLWHATCLHFTHSIVSFC